jgi:uncharacterized NAD(P)/FAD-binding protein YdhS
MKITKTELRQIIKEEVEKEINSLSEYMDDVDDVGPELAQNMARAKERNKQAKSRSATKDKVRDLKIKKVELTAQLQGPEQELEMIVMKNNGQLLKKPGILSNKQYKQLYARQEELVKVVKPLKQQIAAIDKEIR